MTTFLSLTRTFQLHATFLRIWSNDISRSECDPPSPSWPHSESPGWCCRPSGTPPESQGEISSGDSSNASVPEPWVSQFFKNILTKLYHPYHCLLKSLQILFILCKESKKFHSFNHFFLQRKFNLKTKLIICCELEALNKVYDLSLSPAWHWGLVISPHLSMQSASEKQSLDNLVLVLTNWHRELEE